MEKLTPLPLEAAIEAAKVPFSLQDLKSLLADRIAESNGNLETILPKISSEALANLLLANTLYYSEITTAYNDVCKLRRVIAGMRA